jgi:biotin carboxylase
VPPRVVLIVGPRSYRVHEYLEAARRMGVPVTVATRAEWPLAGLGGDGILSIPDEEPEGVVAQVRQLARRTPVGAVVGLEDGTSELAAHVATALGLAGHPPEAVAAARDKIRMRTTLAQAGLPSPQFTTIGGPDDCPTCAIAYPCVVKPARLAAGLGVTRVDHPEQLTSACVQARAVAEQHEPGATSDGPPPLLAESYVAGPEVALEALLVDGELVPLALFDKPDAGQGPHFDETMLVAPSILPDREQQRVLDTVGRATRALGLRTGPLHVEARLGAFGVVILDVAARTIGGLCSQVLRPALGQSLEELVLGAALGRSPRPEPRMRSGGAYGVLMLPAPAAGRLIQVDGVQAARDVPGIEDVVVTAHPGAWLAPAPWSDRYLGFVFARADGPDAVERALRDAWARVHVRLDAGRRRSAGGGPVARDARRP